MYIIFFKNYLHTSDNLIFQVYIFNIYFKPRKIINLVTKKTKLNNVKEKLMLNKNTLIFIITDKFHVNLFFLSKDIIKIFFF